MHGMRTKGQRGIKKYTILMESFMAGPKEGEEKER